MQIKDISKTSYKLTKDKAYILGIIGPGDGFIIKNAGISLSVVDEDFAEAFRKKVEKVYGIKASKTKEKKPSGFGKKLRTKISLYSTRVLEDLKQYNVNFNEHNWRIPSQVKNSSNEIKHAYISGFADSQGSVGKRCITLASKNKKGMDEMIKLIKSVGLRAIISEGSKTLLITVYSRGSLERFYKNIQFNILRKQNNLKKILGNYKNNKYTTLRYEVKLMVPKMVKLINEGYTQLEIANKLNINQSVVCRHLQKLNGVW